MKVTEDQMKVILRPGVAYLCNLLSRQGFEARVAGGAIRDLLTGAVPADLDFATTATPKEMKQIFKEENIRMIDRGGEKHGTIMVRLEDNNFEFTTLRIDRVTDGRHAEVEFTRDWKVDAGRRDLTVNAMSLDLDGTVYDYFTGVEDARERTVRFVGEADTRFKEDYLRILRYFRFYGRIATGPDNFDANILAAIRNNCEGLARISGERIWMEVYKIGNGNYWADILIKMHECGINHYVGLPKTINFREMKKVFNRLQDAGIQSSDCHPCTLLASAFENEDEAGPFIARVKCSNKEKTLLLYVIRHRETENFDTKNIKDLLVQLNYIEKLNLHFSLFLVRELVKYLAKTELLDEVTPALIPKFPIRGGDLVNKTRRSKINVVTKKLLHLWIESDYSMNETELLDSLNNDRMNE